MGYFIDDSYDSEGRPFVQETSVLMQKAVKLGDADIIQALIGPTYDATKVYILWGFTQTSTGTIGFLISAGAVFCNGEIYDYDGGNFSSGLAGGTTLVGDCNPIYTDEPGTYFASGRPHTVHVSRKLTISVAVSGTGQLNGTAGTANDFSNFVRMLPLPSFNYSLGQGNGATFTFTSRGSYIFNGAMPAGGVLNLDFTNAVPGVEVIVNSAAIPGTSTFTINDGGAVAVQLSAATLTTGISHVTYRFKYLGLRGTTNYYLIESFAY